VFSLPPESDKEMCTGITKKNEKIDMNNSNKYSLDDDELNDDENEIHTNNKHIKTNKTSNTD
jgi:hypothetical protein